MTSEALIDGLAVAEPFLMTLLCAGFVAVVVDWLIAGERAAPERSLDAAIPPRTEYALLAIVLAVAMTLRLVGWDSALTPVFWFSEVSTLHVDHMLRTGTLWETWARQLSTTDVLGPHDAAMVLPVLAALQALVGPRFGLPVLCGALYGGLAVLLAWALGRRVRSQAFGLLFAAFVAVSPLALTWSRLSGFCVAGGTHVLLALLVGYEAGRRGSVVLALVTGLVMWTSIYHYYPARLAIALGPAAVLAGGQHASRLVRGVVLAVAATVVCLGALFLVHAGTSAQALWPSYGGYAGNKGERSLREFVAKNAASFATELRHALERYFAFRRMGWSSDVRLPGIGQGGLAILPVTVLGAVGLVATIRRLRREWLWLLLAAAGLALPALSVMTARRILVFDLAWCAFAAQGLLALLDAVGARWTAATRGRLAALVVAAVGAWSVSAVFLLSAALPASWGQQIPFGDAGFSDGLACRRCLEAAKGWSRDMADGAFVVLFDNDVQRENRTSPGGLIAYGKIATLVAGTRGRFVEGYALLAGVDTEPPAPTFVFDRFATDFVRWLTAELDRTRPARIVWHFERPTAWERWLVGRLVAAGGVPELFPTPLSPSSSGLRVVTPWAARDRALAVLREVGAGLDVESDSPCVTLAIRSGFAIDSIVLGLAPDGPGQTTVPDWVATSYITQRYKAFSLAAPLPVGAFARRRTGDQLTVGFFGQDGRQTLYDLPSLKRTDQAAVLPGKYGLGCAAYAAGHWWTVDPWTGKVASTHPRAGSIPKGPWIGMAADPAGLLVLAAADQWIGVFDPARGSEILRFRARVSPSVRQTADECTPIAASADWIALADLRTSVLSVYDRAGGVLGTRRLDRITRSPFPLTALAGAGHYLGVGQGTSVQTFELRTATDCHPEPTSAGPLTPDR